MSFQATHLYFANQVKKILNIQDLTRYFSGTLYPDSRYITDVDRTKTHANARINPVKINNLTDDFYKGWQVHLWYDKLGLPKLFKMATGLTYKQGEMEQINYWIPVTGAKLVEDLYWWEKTDWPKILPYLKFATNPNQENPEILQKWYQHFIVFFQNKPNLEDYRAQAEFMGIPTEKIKKIQTNAYKLYDDKSKRKRIESIMEKVKSEFINLIH